MIPSLLLLLACQLAGELTVRLLGLPVPGPVLGMVLLALGLGLRPQVPAALGDTATGLLGHLSLLFVPAGVGLMLHGPRLAEEWPALLAAMVLSTLASIAAAVLVFRWVARLTGSAGEAP